MNNFRPTINHLSARQLDDYVHERLSRQVMHDVERHLLDCNLCNDAVQGVQEYGRDTFLSNSKKIFLQIFKKPNDQKNKYLFWVAAGISVVLVSGILMYMPQMTNTDSPISMKVESEEIELLPDEEQVKEVQLPVVRNKEELKSEMAKPKPDKSPEIKKSNKVDVVEKKQKVENDIVAEVPLLKSVAEVVDEELSEDMVVAQIDEDEAVADETAGSMEKKIPLGIASTAQKSRLKRSISNNEAPRRSFSSSALVESKPGFTEFMEIKNAVPVIDKATYLNFIREKIDEFDQETKGDIIVLFFVDKNENIVDFRIEKGLNSANDKEVQRLILDGPPWRLLHEQEPIENNRVILKITFN